MFEKLHGRNRQVTGVMSSDGRRKITVEDYKKSLKKFADNIVDIQAEQPKKESAEEVKTVPSAGVKVKPVLTARTLDDNEVLRPEVSVSAREPAAPLPPAVGLEGRGNLYSSFFAPRYSPSALAMSPRHRYMQRGQQTQNTCVPDRYPHVIGVCVHQTQLYSNPICLNGSVRESRSCGQSGTGYFDVSQLLSRFSYDQWWCCHLNN